MKRFILGALFYLVTGTSGHATISCALPFTLTNGTIADATQVMANYNALVTCFTQAASAGANSDITSLSGLTTPITPAQGGTNVFIGGTSTGTSNVQAVAVTTPNTFTLTAGYSVIFIAGFSNGATGPSNMLLDVHSTGSKGVVKAGPSGITALTGGEIIAGQLVMVQYNGANYVLLNPSNQSGGFGTPVAITPSAGTADLSPAYNHYATIASGNISSFGTLLSDNNTPRFLVKFGGALTITYNATSLITPGTANITTAQNDVAELIYLGSGNWQIINYIKANGTAIVNPTPLCGATGLTLSTNGTTASIVYAADSAVLINPTGNVPIYVTGVSGTINSSVGTVTSTVDAMDGEATPVSTFGFVYLISNGTTTGGLVSTSTTAPTMPSGYTYRCRVGAIRFSAAPIPLVHKTWGNQTNYFPTAGGNTTTFQVIQSTGAAFAGALTSLTAPPAGTTITSFVPSTATHVRLLMACTTNCTLALSTSAATNGNVFSATNPSECQVQDTSVTTRICELPYNAGAVFFQAANAGTWSISVMGWKDKVNAD